MIRIQRRKRTRQPAKKVTLITINPWKISTLILVVWCLFFTNWQLVFNWFNAWSPITVLVSFSGGAL